MGMILDDFEEIEEEMDDEEEEGWHLAAAQLHGCKLLQGMVEHCCAEPCRTAPYTGNVLVREFLKGVESLQRRAGRGREIYKL
jgi:hypothetical protein